MIRVTLEIVPQGDEPKARRSGQLEVWHVHEDADQMADYRGWVETDGQRKPLEVRRHFRPAGAWQLVMLALQDALGGRR
jgi:hypothetical protein